MDWNDLDAFQALPRLSGLALSPDGTRLVTTVALLDDEKTWVTALWELDPHGAEPAVRLTRGPGGESSPVFRGDGDLLFLAKRGDDEVPGLWRLPLAGEAERVATRPGGVGGPVVRGDRVLVSSDTLPGEDDERERLRRKDRGISAVLHTGYPVRFWDHDLGPGEPRLLLHDGTSWTDLTPVPGRALDDASYDLSPDGSRVVTTWAVAEPHGSSRTTLRLDGEVLADGAEHEWSSPVFSPDGSRVAALRTTRSTPADCGDVHLVVIDVTTGDQQVVQGWDRWPLEVVWSAEGRALLSTADEDGCCPVFRVDLESGRVTRLTTDRGAYGSLVVGPDAVFAVRTALDAPPQPVRIDASVPGAPLVLPSPADGLVLPGTLTEVTSTGEDGRPVRSWLVLPDVEGPHPLVLWVHGGPLMSWDGWSWRWNPWLLAARGWAVLLPDPALSTGYGLAHVQAGWGAWGAAPYTDLMRAVDAALERDDLDSTRTAAMGGSFGGYMTNWIAGHTDRFRALVTHASLWDLEQFGRTTDAAWYWGREMTPEMTAANNPRASRADIVTPVLVIHGDRDYRVPIGEALALWRDLCAMADDPATMPHRFLYFPDENHWVLSPGNAVVWYDTVLGFLETHARS